MVLIVAHTMPTIASKGGDCLDGGATYVRRGSTSSSRSGLSMQNAECSTQINQTTSRGCVLIDSRRTAFQIWNLPASGVRIRVGVKPCYIFCIKVYFIWERKREKRSSMKSWRVDEGGGPARSGALLMTRSECVSTQTSYFKVSREKILKEPFILCDVISWMEIVIQTAGLPRYFIFYVALHEACIRINIFTIILFRTDSVTYFILNTSLNKEI